MVVASYDSFHQWFGRADLQQFSCEPGGGPAIPAADGTWTYTCSNEDRTEVYEVEGLGADTLTVEGEPVPVFHVRVMSSLSRGSEGTADVETWYLQGSSLVVRRVVTRLSMNDSAIGTVTYRETYEINLLSGAPQAAGR